MVEQDLVTSNYVNPRLVSVLTPRMLPIITDGVISIVLTEDYRINPYLVRKGSQMAVASIVVAAKADLALRYVMGNGLDPKQMWLSAPLQNGLRTMAAGWVIFFDCNPDRMLVKSVKEQNEYLTTRDQLGLPQLRWAEDLKLMAERHCQASGGMGH